jgi:hypothetical protein
MKIFKFVLIVLALIMAIKCSMDLDYTDFSWSKNSDNYRLIIISICVITSMLLLRTPYEEQEE